MKNIRLSKGLIGILFLLAGSNAYAATYHFSTSGNNTTGNGSQNTPYYSLCGAWNGDGSCTTGANRISLGQIAINPGDQLLFRRGDEWVGRDAVWSVNTTGAPGNPVTFGAYGDSNLPRPVFRAAKSAFELGKDNWTNVAGTSIWYTTGINWTPYTAGQEDSAVDGAHLFAAFSVQGTTNANGWSSNQSMVRGTYHYESSSQRLYVWRTDNQRPDHSAGRDIFIGENQYDGTNRLIKVKRASGVAGSHYIFRDLHAKFASHIGMSTSYPNTEFINCLSEMNGQEGFLFDRRRFSAPLPGSKDGVMRNCIARRNNLQQGVGIGQGITIESENVWLYDSESYENAYAGVDFLDYSTNTKTDGSGMQNCKIHHNGIQPTFHNSFDANVYIDGGSNITVRDSQIWAAGVDPRGTKTRLRTNAGIHVDVEGSGFNAGKRPTNIKIVNTLSYGNAGQALNIGPINGGQSSAAFSNIQVIGCTLGRDRGDSDIRGYYDQNLVDYGVRVFGFNNISSGLVFKNNIIVATNTARAPVFGSKSMLDAGKSVVDFNNNMYSCAGCNFNTNGNYGSGGFFSYNYIQNLTIDQFRNLGAQASLRQDEAFTKAVVMSNPLLTNLTLANFDARLNPSSPALDIADISAFPFSLSGSTSSSGAADNPYNDLGFHYALSQGGTPAPDTQAPTAPGALAAVQSGSQVLLSWSAATDNVGVTSYQVLNGATTLGTSPAPGYTHNAAVGQTYNYSVRALDAAGNASSPSNTVTLTVGAPPDTVPPTVPTGLSAALAGTQVSLSWNASTDNVGVTGYEILHNGGVIGTSASTAFLHNGSAGSTYNYTVRARDAATNVSPSSTIVTVTVTQPSTGPTAPSNLVGGFVNGQVQLSWDEATDHIGYNLFRNDVFLKTTNSESSFDNTGLPGNTYQYKVQAYDAANLKSAFSNEVSVTIPGSSQDVEPPAVPAGFSATLQVSGGLLIDWAEPADNVGVTGYKVFNNGTLLATPAASQHTVSLLGGNNTFLFGVEACDAAGNCSAPGNLVIVTLPPPAPAADTTAPGAPTGLSASLSGTTANLSWNAATDNVGVTGYQVFQGSTLRGNTSATSYAVTGLATGQSHSFTVKAYDAANNVSAASNTASVSVPAPAPTAPTTPTNLIAYLSGSSVQLAWGSSSNATGYAVHRNGSFLKNVTGLSTSDSTVVIGQTYTYQVRSFDNSNNFSGFSNSMTVSIPDDAPPSAPSSLSAFLSGTTVNLSWAPATDNVGVAGYRIYQGGSYRGTTAALTYAVSGLSYGQTYSFTVRAYDADDNLSSASNTATVSVADTASPTAPTGLSASLSGTTANLSWNASSDNVGVAGYQVFQGSTLKGTTSGTTYAVSGLAAGQSYSFTVRAFDGANNLSSSSNSASVTVSSTQPPVTPNSLTGYVDATNTIRLSWTGAATNAGYNLYRNGVFVKSVPTTTASDYPGPGTFTYKVRAYNAAGTESGPSADFMIAIR